MDEAVVVLGLTYLEVCQLLESGTVKAGSSIDVKLRGAREALESNRKLPFREPSEAERVKTQQDLKSGKIPTRRISLDG